MTDATDVTPEPAAARSRAFWPRAAFMLLFVLLFALAETALFIIAVLQAAWLGFTGAPNPHIRRFGASLSRWLAAVGRYQACESDERPYPFAPWPGEGEGR